MMEKKRSVGVTVFGLSLLYFPIMAIVKLMKVCQYSAKMPENKALFFKIAYPNPLLAFSLFAAFIIIAICVLKLSRWAYYTLIAIASLSIIQDVYGFIRMFKYISPGSSIKISHFIEPTVTLLYFIALLYFFTRPKVKEQFK